MKKLIFLPILMLTMSISYGQWTSTNLSEPKEAMGTTAFPGSGIFWFAGGWGDIEETNKVEIYNANTDTWSYASLSQARSWPVGLAHQNHILFAGGMNWNTYQPTSRVDVLGIGNPHWVTTELSIPRFSISAVGIGNKVIFAGGADITQNKVFSRVDLLNIYAGQWTTAELSTPRAAMGSAVVETPNGFIALFGGGSTAISGPFATDVVDIYHANTDTWSVAKLSQARSHLSAATVGNKVIFAGGITNDNVLSDRVDIYDALTGQWTTASLSVPRCTDMTDGLTKTVCGKVYVVGGGRIDLITGIISDGTNVIDIYDPATDTWSVEYLNRPLITHSVVSDGNRLLIAGGRNTEFSTVYDEVDIYTCSANAASENKVAAAQYRIYPNPNNGSFFLERIGDDLQKPAVARVYNALGELVAQRNLSQMNERVELNLAPATYVLTIISDSNSQTEKLVIQ